MEAGESGLDGDVLEESSSDEDRPAQVLHDEAPIESDCNSILEGEDIINGANNAILEADFVPHPDKEDPTLPSRSSSSSSSSSSRSSKAPSEDHLTEVVTGEESGRHSVPLECDTPSDSKDDGNVPEEEHKDEPLDSATTSPMDIPTIQTMDRSELYNPDRIPESVFATSDPDTPMEWSSASNESLFSIHPTFSFGGDQAFLLAAEMDKAKESDEAEDLAAEDDLPQASVEQHEDKSVGEYKVKAQRIEQHKAKSPNPATLIANASVRSDGSEGSTYSFAFPILTGTSHSSSTKGDAFSSRWRNSRAHHLEAESSTSRQPTPSQSSSPSPSPSRWKKVICCSCFLCLSCYSFLSSHSCCKRKSCFSSCTLPSCFSSCTRPSCPSCFSCCKRPSCPSCHSCWPCR